MTTVERRVRKLVCSPQKVDKILAIMVGAYALLLTASMMSFHPNDPSAFHQPLDEGASVRNWIGPIGANVSALLFALMGVPALLLPVVLGGIAWRRLSTLELERARVFGMALAAVIVSLSGICQLIIGQATWRGVTLNAGGVLGVLLARLLLSRLNFEGAFLVLVTMLTVSGSLAAPRTVIRLAEISRRRKRPQDQSEVPLRRSGGPLVEAELRNLVATQNGERRYTFRKVLCKGTGSPAADVPAADLPVTDPPALLEPSELDNVALRDLSGDFSTPATKALPPDSNTAKKAASEDLRQARFRDRIHFQKVFISYAREDEAFRKELEEHLAALKRDGRIEIWHDRRITAGDDWQGQIDEHLETADLILLLVSASFIASDYCWDVEATRALERHARGEARVVPVIVRACDWQGAPFSTLQILPQDGEPVAEWVSRDKAWQDVTKGLRQELEAERFRRLLRKGPQLRAGGFLGKGRRRS